MTDFKNLKPVETNILQTEKDKQIFFDALQNPAPPNERLKRVRLKYLQIKAEE